MAKGDSISKIKYNKLSMKCCSKYWTEFENRIQKIHLYYSCGLFIRMWKEYLQVVSICTERGQLSNNHNHNNQVVLDEQVHVLRLQIKQSEWHWQPHQLKDVTNSARLGVRAQTSTSKILAQTRNKLIIRRAGITNGFTDQGARTIMNHQSVLYKTYQDRMRPAPLVVVYQL